MNILSLREREKEKLAVFLVFVSFGEKFKSGWTLIKLELSPASFAGNETFSSKAAAAALPRLSFTSAWKKVLHWLDWSNLGIFESDASEQKSCFLWNFWKGWRVFFRVWAFAELCFLSAELQTGQSFQIPRGEQQYNSIVHNDATERIRIWTFGHSFNSQC